LSVAGLSRTERDRRVRATAQLLGLDDRLKAKPSQLSGGQRQRVALGRAIVREPALFLLDEPLSNLDADLRARMRLEIVKLQKQLQTTTVYVTHDQTEALTMADRIAVLNDGRLEQVGTPEKLYRDPATLFVAEFIGQPKINTFLAVNAADASRRLGANHDLGEEVDRTVGHILAAVRSEAITIDAAGPLEGKVTACEYLGDEYIVIVRAGDISLTVSGARRSYEIGEALRLRVDDDAVLVFDPNSGQRLDNR
jgi:multiple sugar transport system ATP-binding protein